MRNTLALAQWRCAQTKRRQEASDNKRTCSPKSDGHVTSAAATSFWCLRQSARSSRGGGRARGGRGGGRARGGRRRPARAAPPGARRLTSVVVAPDGRMKNALLGAGRHQRQWRRAAAPPGAGRARRVAAAGARSATRSLVAGVVGSAHKLTVQQQGGRSAGAVEPELRGSSDKPPQQPGNKKKAPRATRAQNLITSTFASNHQPPTILTTECSVICFSSSLFLHFLHQTQSCGHHCCSCSVP